MVHLYFFQDPELLSSLPFPKHLSIWREGRKGEEGSSESVLSCDTTPHLFSTYGPEKEKKVLVNQSCPTLCVPMDSGPHRLLCPGDFPGKNIGVGLPFLPAQDVPDPGIEPASLASPALADGFFTMTPLTLQVPLLTDAQGFLLFFSSRSLET